MTLMFGHLSVAIFAKSAALLTIAACRLTTAGLTARLTVPQHHPLAPFPWLVAKSATQ
uniref:Uncharacterized protein n=1 Tax=Anguilla anguilla TaxID=7936 RepID=A0A0E9PVI1_ANGAN